MSERNRAEGWQYAKLSGHKNEELVAKLVESDKATQQRLLACANISNFSIEQVMYGGLYEESVESVFGDATKSKTDMWILLSNGECLNISIKKDVGGQVYLIGINRFIEGFEKQYEKIIPENVKRAISLYFGIAEDTIEIINKFGTLNKELELRKHRLVADTLKAYDVHLYTCLLVWFADNIGDIFDFCFSRGLAKNSDDWAHIVWYKNLVGEDDCDKLLYLPQLKNKIPAAVEYGGRNGGSTIQLPFGFVQWHSPNKTIPGSMQFHHSFEKMLHL